MQKTEIVVIQINGVRAQKYLLSLLGKTWWTGRIV